MMSSKAYHTTFDRISDLEQKVGEELGISGWRTVSQEDINTFAELTDDHQWIHLDVERCKRESPYGTPIAHGYLVLSYASVFLRECYRVANCSMAINYGLDKVRFINAVKAGSRLRARVTLTKYLPLPNGARLFLEVAMQIEGEERPACVAIAIGQLYE